MARRRRTRPNPVPVGYLALSVLLAVVLLPTALRPPPDQQNATASFSPDAPPDDQAPELILQSLRQAGSATAGGRAVAVDEVVEQEAPPPPPRPRKPTRARCFGDPPRQTESLYSALCVPAWTGSDNGGDTARGVTATEIRVAIQSTERSLPEGPLEREFRDDDGESERRLKVWQTYFNERFEFYGRYLQFYVVKVPTSDDDGARARIREAAEQWNSFAYISSGESTAAAAAAAEAVRMRLVNFVSGRNPVDWYKDAHPYAYGFDMDSWQTRYIGPELACKHWWGRPPGELNAKADPTFDYGAPRVFGLILYQDTVRQGARRMYEENFRKLCGGTFARVHEYNLSDNQAAIGDAVAKMREGGVTTIMLAVDELTPAILTNSAQRIGYSPEWIGVTGTEGNGTGRLMQDDQANHMISVIQREIPRSDADKDWYRAYKEVDPDGEPAATWFRDLQQLAGGIQHAGPHLTPETFYEGITKNARTYCRTPEPEWSIGGCFRKPDAASPLHYLGDYTYADYVALAWFDNAGDDPDSSSSGAWCYMYNGRRFSWGKLPADRLPFRSPADCIVTPERGVQG